MIKGDPWWVLTDVARVLGYRDATAAGRILRDKHKGTHQTCTPGGEQEMLVVNEAGLYRLMMRSDRPEAERFQDWITHEVIPSIRRTGTPA
jgi:anti-repressor protein